MSLFVSGVHPRGRKERTSKVPITALPAPGKLWVPLSRHIGAPALPVVSAGERVLRGQLIAHADGKVSANVYSPVSGTVGGVVGHILPTGKKGDHILIENDFEGETALLPPLAGRTPESVLARIAEAGIVGMGGAGFPTAAKLDVRGRAEVLVVNGAECEPYITCDERIMLEYADELLQGVRLAMLACGAARAVIGIEKNKPEAISLLSQKCGRGGEISVKALRTRYPQGAEKQLILGCTGRTVPEGGLPVDAGAVVVNVHTALAIYRAVEENMPCFERVITVSGGAVEEPRNLWVANGTPLQALADACGADADCARIVSGGPMMGEAVFSLKVCTASTTSALLFLTEEECSARVSSTCIGCGRCVQACPMGLMPVYIESALLAKNYGEAKRFGAPSCIGCGCCSYVCPAKRYLAQSVKLAKKIIKERGI